MAKSPSMAEQCVCFMAKHPAATFNISFSAFSNKIVPGVMYESTSVCVFFSTIAESSFLLNAGRRGPIKYFVVQFLDMFIHKTATFTHNHFGSRIRFDSWPSLAQLPSERQHIPAVPPASALCPLQFSMQRAKATADKRVEATTKKKSCSCCSGISHRQKEECQGHFGGL